MAVCGLRILVDLCWYLAFMMPIIRSVPPLLSWPLCALPCVWAIWMFANWNRRDFWKGLQDNFFFEIKFLSAAIFLELIGLGTTRWQEQCGPFVVLFFALGFLLLRVGRLSGNEQGKVRFWGLNGFYIGLALIAAAICASRTVRLSIVRILGAGYRTLILPVLEGMIWLLLKIAEFLVPILGPLFGNFQKLELKQAQIDVSSIGDNMEPVVLREFPAWVKSSGYLILALFAVAVFVYLFRRLSGSEGVRKREAAAIVQRSEATVEKEEKAGLRLFGRERNVRYYYRKFLKLCLAQDVKLKCPLTTETAHEAASEYWDEGRLTELRDLYRSVRYGGTPDGLKERKRAAEIYRELKEEKK